MGKVLMTVVTGVKQFHNPTPQSSLCVQVLDAVEAEEEGVAVGVVDFGEDAVVGVVEGVEASRVLVVVAEGEVAGEEEEEG